MPNHTIGNQHGNQLKRTDDRLDEEDPGPYCTHLCFFSMSPRGVCSKRERDRIRELLLSHPALRAYTLLLYVQGRRTRRPDGYVLVAECLSRSIATCRFAIHPIRPGAKFCVLATGFAAGGLCASQRVAAPHTLVNPRRAIWPMGSRRSACFAPSTIARGNSGLLDVCRLWQRRPLSTVRRVAWLATAFS